MNPKSKSAGFSFFKAARWIVLALLVFVISAAVRKPLPPAPALSPAQISENAKSFEGKLAQMQQSRQQGETVGDARFSADEVNSFISEASARGAVYPAAGAAAPAVASNPEDMPVKSTQVGFQGDEVIAQAVTERYGQDIYITLRGKLGASDGYLTFAPTEFQIGRLNVPVSLINPTLSLKIAPSSNCPSLFPIFALKTGS